MRKSGRGEDAWFNLRHKQRTSPTTAISSHLATFTVYDEVNDSSCSSLVGNGQHVKENIPETHSKSMHRKRVCSSELMEKSKPVETGLWKCRES